MEHVSFCPHRTGVNHNWSTTVQTTPYTEPVWFNGTIPDKNLLEVCEEVERGEQHEGSGSGKFRRAN